MSLLGLSLRVHDVLPLLGGDDHLLFLRRVPYHDAPDYAPDQAGQALNVEDPLPVELHGDHTRQEHEDDRAKGSA